MPSRRENQKSIQTTRTEQDTHVTVGDQVLLKQDKVDKFSTTFNKTPHKVIRKDGNNVVVKSPSGATYSRNTTFVKKYYTEEPAPQSTNKTQLSETENEEHRNKQAADYSTETNSEGIGPEPLTPQYERRRRQIKLPQKLADFIIM